MLIPAQKPTDVRKHLTDFAKTKPFHVVNPSASIRRQKKERSHIQATVTHLSWHLLGRSQWSPEPRWWLGRRKSQSATRGPCLHARHAASSNTTDEEVNKTPSYSIQPEKSKYPWVEQAPGWAITANWNKLPLYPPIIPPSCSHSPPLLLSHHFFLLYFEANLLLGLRELLWKMSLIKGCIKFWLMKEGGLEDAAVKKVLKLLLHISQKRAKSTCWIYGLFHDFSPSLLCGWTIMSARLKRPNVDDVSKRNAFSLLLQWSLRAIKVYSWPLFCINLTKQTIQMWCGLAYSFLGN